MKVTVINPEMLRDLHKNHGEFACVCYGTDPKHAEKVGADCAESGHLSGSRCEYIKFRISDVDRGTCEQMLRHELGTSVPYEYQDNYSFAEYSDLVLDVSPDQIVKNMASFRYIDKDNFRWAIPDDILRFEPIMERWNSLMLHINNERYAIKEMLEAEGIPPKQATEDVNQCLPRATLSEFVIGFTPEALIHFMHKRLCTRAQEYIHKLAHKMCLEIRQINPAFAAELKPHCEHLFWCPEKKHSCGRYPTKDKLMKIIAAGKEALNGKGNPEA